MCLYACWIMHMKLSDGHKSLKYKEKFGTQHVLYLTGCLGSRVECAETTMEIGTIRQKLTEYYRNWHKIMRLSREYVLCQTHSLALLQEMEKSLKFYFKL